VSDCYAGVDLLADVFEGTEDAPVPVPLRNSDGHLVKLWPNPSDPRWSMQMSLHRNGDVDFVQYCVPRAGQEVVE
jgi:hypothetical protein